MAMQSIGILNRDDAFYRYKMPVMVTKVERHHNIKRTNVVNMAAIAKALARPASYIAKYIGGKLAVQSNFDEKKGACFVGGAHDTAELAELLDVFVEKYVLCYECGNPETEIVVSETTRVVSLECAACGFVSDVDMGDKLSTFIQKHPPGKKKKGGKEEKKALRRAEKEGGAAGGDERKKLEKNGARKKGASSSKESSAKGSKKKKAAAGSDEERPASPTCSRDGDDAAAAEEEEEDDDVVWQTDTSMAAAKQRMQEQLRAGTAQMVMLCTESE